MNRAIQSYCRPTSITDGGQKMTGVLGASARYIDITAAAAAIDTVVFSLHTNQDTSNTAICIRSLTVVKPGSCRADRIVSLCRP